MWMFMSALRRGLGECLNSVFIGLSQGGFGRNEFGLVRLIKERWLRWNISSWLEDMRSVCV